VIRDYVKDIKFCAEQAITKPSDFGYWGHDNMFVTWGFCGIDKNPSSDILTISNFDVISADLMERFPKDFRIEEYRHWAVGSVTRLVCRVYRIINNEKFITPAFYEAMKWQNDLLDYPVADENHFSQLEYDNAVENMQYYLSTIRDIVRLDKSDYTAEDIISYTSENFCCDYESINDYEVYEAIYELGFCNLDDYDFWSEWCKVNGRPMPNTEEYLASRDPNQLKINIGR
jgi:hypothetical protein